MLKQDLHIHTTYSTTDNSVVPEQTVSLVAAVKHAVMVGVSDHFECLVNGDFEGYEKEIRRLGLKVGIDVGSVGDQRHPNQRIYLFELFQHFN